MLPENGNLRRGSFDPLGLTILGFLITSLVVGTVALVQNNFDIRERAQTYSCEDQCAILRNNAESYTSCLNSCRGHVPEQQVEREEEKPACTQDGSQKKDLACCSGKQYPIPGAVICGEQTIETVCIGDNHILESGRRCCSGKTHLRNQTQVYCGSVAPSPSPFAWCPPKCTNGCVAPKENSSGPLECSDYCSDINKISCGSECIPTKDGGICTRAQELLIPPLAQNGTICDSSTDCISGHCAISTHPDFPSKCSEKPVVCPSTCKSGCDLGSTVCREYCSDLNKTLCGDSCLKDSSGGSCPTTDISNCPVDETGNRLPLVDTQTGKPACRFSEATGFKACVFENYSIYCSENLFTDTVGLIADCPTDESGRLPNFLGQFAICTDPSEEGLPEGFSACNFKGTVSYCKDSTLIPNRTALSQCPLDFLGKLPVTIEGKRCTDPVALAMGSQGNSEGYAPCNFGEQVMYCPNEAYLEYAQNVVCPTDASGSVARSTITNLPVCTQENTRQPDTIACKETNDTYLYCPAAAIYPQLATPCECPGFADSFNDELTPTLGADETLKDSLGLCATCRCENTTHSYMYETYDCRQIVESDETSPELSLASQIQNEFDLQIQYVTTLDENTLNSLHQALGLLPLGFIDHLADITIVDPPQIEENQTEFEGIGGRMYDSDSIAISQLEELCGSEHEVTAGTLPCNYLDDYITIHEIAHTIGENSVPETNCQGTACTNTQVVYHYLSEEGYIFDSAGNLLVIPADRQGLPCNSYSSHIQEIFAECGAAYVYDPEIVKEHPEIYEFYQSIYGVEYEVDDTNGDYSVTQKP